MCNFGTLIGKPVPLYLKNGKDNYLSTLNGKSIIMNKTLEGLRCLETNFKKSNLD